MFDRNYNTSWRSRRRGNSYSPAFSPRSTYRTSEPPLEQLLKGLGKEVRTIPLPSSGLGKHIPVSVSIEGFQVLASYNWLEASTPTIIVPGCPPVWEERALPYTVPRNSGTVFVDQNALRLPISPLLPLIEAVSHHSPDFSFPSVDFVTDRNGLRILIRWAQGDTDLTTFRIDFELVGTKTVLMQRWIPESTQVNRPGFDRGLEKASTTAGVGCEEATEHHRIVTYDFGGFKMLVRFEVDACLRSTESKTGGDPLEGLAGLQSPSVTPSLNTIKRIPTSNGSSLSIITRGQLVPQSSILELKSRSIKSIPNFGWEDTHIQMLLSQTPRLFLCVHENGKFLEVQERTLGELESSELGRKAQDKLRMVRMILGKIQETAQKVGKGVRLSLICKRGAGMMIYERGGKGGLLPEKTLEKFKLEGKRFRVLDSPYFI